RSPSPSPGGTPPPAWRSRDNPTAPPPAPADPATHPTSRTRCRKRRFDQSASRQPRPRANRTTAPPTPPRQTPHPRSPHASSSGTPDRALELRRGHAASAVSTGLRHDADVRPRRLPVTKQLPRLLVGHGSGDDHVLALPPVHGRGHLVPGGQLQR